MSYSGHRNILNDRVHWRFVSLLNMCSLFKQQLFNLHDLTHPQTEIRKTVTLRRRSRLSVQKLTYGAPERTCKSFFLSRYNELTRANELTRYNEIKKNFCISYNDVSHAYAIFLSFYNELQKNFCISMRAERSCKSFFLSRYNEIVYLIVVIDIKFKFKALILLVPFGPLRCLVLPKLIWRRFVFLFTCCYIISYYNLQ